MIFYFSGTGNSKYIAQRLADYFDDELIEICEDTINKKKEYKISAEERIGFVCPVYWYTVPKMVEKFIEYLTLQGYQGQYMYCVATYGGSSGHMMNQVQRKLKGKGYLLSGKFGVRMVDNYVIAYNTADATKKSERIQEAKKSIESHIPYIEQRQTIERTKKGAIAFATPLLKPFYSNANHTKKFYATEQCIHCGKCELGCPCNVISMVDGKPQWSGDCSFCLKCINTCPVEAIQYGKKTINRRRYQFSEDNE